MSGPMARPTRRRSRNGHRSPSRRSVEHAPYSLRFGFRFDSWYRLAALPFGVSPSSAHVDVRTSAEGQRLLVARFGPWQVSTPVTNVLSTTVTGPYATVKTIGPAHVSLRDLGLTFATNRARGLCIRFRNAVPGLAPTSLIRHPALTVTVDDSRRSRPACSPCDRLTRTTTEGDPT